MAPFFVMKNMNLAQKIFGAIATSVVALGCGSTGKQIQAEDKPTEGMSIYDVKLKTLNEQDDLDLSQFKGKYMLFVNVASQCGFTYQYEGLEALYEAQKDKLVIIGLPCNQFGLQEPGDSSEIASFCKVNFGVTFPLSQKLDVKGKNQHPVYEWLTKKEFNELDDYTVSWNFNKFLVSPEGKLLAYFGSKVKPESEEIVSLIK